MQHFLLGDLASHALSDNSLRNVVEVHEGWAGAATSIFLVMAIAYALTAITMIWGNPFRNSNGDKYWQLLLKVKDVVMRFGFLFAIAGLVAITVTGALGAAMVHSPDIDPIVRIIYNLLI